ncbi:MAG: hypothetical protein Q7R95_08445 [bacterium]|nr:hypothetical protein [bacterium]
MLDSRLNHIPQFINEHFYLPNKNQLKQLGIGIQHYNEFLTHQKISRRTFLILVGMLGLAIASTACASAIPSLKPKTEELITTEHYSNTDLDIYAKRQISMINLFDNDQNKNIPTVFKQFTIDTIDHSLPSISIDTLAVEDNHPEVRPETYGNCFGYVLSRLFGISLQKLGGPELTDNDYVFIPQLVESGYATIVDKPQTGDIGLIYTNQKLRHSFIVDWVDTKTGVVMTEGKMNYKLPERSDLKELMKPTTELPDPGKIQWIRPNKKLFESYFASFPKHLY